MTLVIHTDASRQIGSGHVMRMIALGQSWKNFHGSVYFNVGDDCPASIRDRIDAEGFEFLDKTAPADPDVIVYDGYHFSDEIQSAASDTECTVAYVDDYAHLEKYPVDFVINQNAYASQALYKNSSLSGTLLAGTKFVLLRDEFTRHARPASRHQPFEKILITIGGADPAGLSGKVVESLEKIDARLDIRLISAVGFQDSELRSTLDLSRHSITVLEGCNDMFSEFRWADFVVTAAGSSIWECIYAQVPFAFFCVAENQELNTRQLVDDHVGYYLDQSNDWEATLCDAIDHPNQSEAVESTSLKIDVDGFGAARVCAHLAKSPIWLRQITSDDCEWLWKLANDKSVRSVSLSSTKIKWVDHQRWFENSLRSSQKHIFVAVDRDQETRVGYVRFEKDNEDRMVVSIALEPQFRGRSLATPILLAGENYLRSEFSFDGQLFAWIKEANIASRKTFERSGYRVIEMAAGAQTPLCFVKSK